MIQGSGKKNNSRLVNHQTVTQPHFLSFANTNETKLTFFTAHFSQRFYFLLHFSSAPQNTGRRKQELMFRHHKLAVVSFSQLFTHWNQRFISEGETNQGTSILVPKTRDQEPGTKSPRVQEPGNQEPRVHETGNNFRNQEPEIRDQTRSTRVQESRK